MQYLTQKELKEMMLLSHERIEREKEEINKINIFPVPDQDTGNNLTKTLLGIKEAIQGKEFKDLKEISEVILDGALTCAQGNAGVIYTGFLAGFLPELNKEPVDIKKIALAFEKGAERARESIQDPKEGTILDVIEAAASVFKQEAEKEKDIIGVFKKAEKKASEALLETREKMEIFKKANVVDAGGLGFLIILESYLDSLKGRKQAKAKKEEKASKKIKRFVQLLSNRYEVVSLIENPKIEARALQEKLRKLGNSIDIVQGGNKMKIHIHTDYPDEVKNVLRQTGQIQSLRIEDMAKEVVGEESVRKISVGIVTEDISTLLPKIIERYQIELVFAKLDWPPEKDLPGKNIYEKLREADKRGIKIFPKTSQATPRSYFNAFKKQLKKFDKVLCITVSSKVSGCYDSAKQAQTMIQKPKSIFILDSLSGAAGEALLVLRAIELIQEQREINEIIKELKKEISKTHLYLVFEDPKWIEASGKITESQANWIRRMKKLKFHPIMELKNGVIGKGGVVFAQDTAEALLKKILKESKRARKQGKKIRVIINHSDNLQTANKLKKMLKGKIKVEVPFISLNPPLFSAAGPGTLIVGWAAI